MAYDSVAGDCYITLIHIQHASTPPQGLSHLETKLENNTIQIFF